MKAMSQDWYKKIWSLDIKNHSWVEDTENEVDFIIHRLALSGKERILDLACGFGRHAISFARRGFSVTGIDITQDYIDDALKTANSLSLNIEFICDDIRNINYHEEFDVVLSLADGGIGYLENDEENLKIFDVISNALKPNGKHFMDVCNADHASMYFPKKHWEIGTNAVSFAELDWIPKTKRMLFGQWEIIFGQIACKPLELLATSTRLYTKTELRNILRQRHMQIIGTYSNYFDKKDTFEELQLMVYSKKQMT